MQKFSQELAAQRALLLGESSSSRATKKKKKKEVLLETIKEFPCILCNTFRRRKVPKRDAGRGVG